MRHYKAIVIDGKKIVRRGLALGIAAVVVSLSLVNVKIAVPDLGRALSVFSGQRIVDESFPVLKGVEQDSGESGEWGVFEGLRKGICFVLTFDPWDGRTVIFGEVPLVRAVSGSYLAMSAEAKAVYNPKDADQGQGEAEPETPSGAEYPIKEVDSSQAKALGKNSDKILIRNETDFSINIEEMLSQPLVFDMKGESPKVLIVHTHATESYSPQGADTYDTEKSDRSLDCSQNMVKVGETMKQVFEKNGISVLHDTTLHDHPNFNGSYENSRKTVEAYLKKYPDISVVLDIHRDAFVYEDGSKAKFVSEIDGEKAAQLMFVVGSNGGGLEHPNWRENMKLALKLQSSIGEKYPTLMRGVNLRTERFNGHLAPGSLIIEVGSSGNTLDEALRGAACGAEAISEFLNTLK